MGWLTEQVFGRPPLDVAVEQNQVDGQEEGADDPDDGEGVGAGLAGRRRATARLLLLYLCYRFAWSIV